MIGSTLYAKLIAERANGKVIEDEFGFLTYRCDGSECFLIDIYVVPEKRSSGHGRSLIDRLVEAAKDSGAFIISSNVYLSDPGATNTLLAAIMVGFRVASANAGVLFLTKEVGD